MGDEIGKDWVLFYIPWWSPNIVGIKNGLGHLVWHCNKHNN